MGNMTTLQILQGIKTWVTTKLNLKQDVINDLANIRSGAQAGSTAVQPAELSAYFNDASYDNNTHRINFYHGQTVVAYVDASPFIIDGMVDDVRIENGYLVIDFNTASGKQDISIPLTDIFNPNNYYNKTQTDGLLAHKQDTIEDLSDIRSGASAGSTAVQPSTLNNVVKDVVAESGVYDVSANNDNAKFKSLSALLRSANLNTLIPTDIRKGGMSIKFIQLTPATYSVVKTEGLTEQPTGTEIQEAFTIDTGTYTAAQLPVEAPATTATYWMAVTKTVEEVETTTYTTWVITKVTADKTEYVQNRYMSSSTAVADFTNVANWQGVDSKPMAGSRNLIDSGVVFNELNINESATPPISDFMKYGATENRVGRNIRYVSRTNRVSVKLPSEIDEVTFSSIAHGYHAALQETYTQDPTQGLPTMSGTVVADSGWVESNAVPKTIQKNQSSNYLVVTIAKTNSGVINVPEAISAVSFSYTLPVGKIERLSEQVSELDLQLNGADNDVVYDNTNMSSDNWMTYTASSHSRGRYYIKIPDFIKTYSVSFSVASDSTILVGGGLGTSKSQNSNYIYETGWIQPGRSASLGNASDPSGKAAYILINTRYVDTDSASTYNEFAQYCTFSIHITFKTGGIVQYIKKKCLLSATNVKMVAHRGFHLNDVPENSIDAYRWAGYLGFDLAETDFCPTADDELVLMHDASINRTMKNIDNTAISDTVNVVSKTLAELRENYVLASNDPRYRRPIPTLEEYFITCRESNIFPIPEIKQSGTTQEHVLAAYNMGKRIMGAGNFGFCSFSYELLDYARSLDENIPLWYIGTSILGTNNSITGQSRESPKNVWYPSAGSYSYSSELVAQYHAKGMQVAVWTVPVNQFDNRLKDDVDYIATDNSGSNLSKIEGVVFDETDMETTGNLTNSGIFLAAGQHATIQGDFMEIGIYYVSVIASGNYTITAPNLSETINDADYTRRVWQGLIDNKSATITITAVGDTTIQFVNAKIVLVK